MSRIHEFATDWSKDMPEAAGQLPADVQAALERGDSIDAIMLLRESTGLGLKEAKEAIDQHLRGSTVRITERPSMPLPAEVVEEMERGNKIEAIRLLREQTGLGLKEAKEAVEALPDAYAAARRSLGEEPKGVSGGWWFVLVVIAVLVGFFLIRRLG